MKAVYCEKQENGRTLLVTERTEELLPRGNHYLRQGGRFREKGARIK